jgi:hypothetical protein
MELTLYFLQLRLQVEGVVVTLLQVEMVDLVVEEAIMVLQAVQELLVKDMMEQTVAMQSQAAAAVLVPMVQDETAVMVLHHL